MDPTKGTDEAPMIHLAVEYAVPPGRTVTSLRGRVFEVVKVRHVAYVYDGKFYRYAQAIGAKHHVYELPQRGAGWPQPGPWFEQLARVIAGGADGAVAS